MTITSYENGLWPMHAESDVLVTVLCSILLSVACCDPPV